ncbi:MAG: hypothetical protein IT458_17065 [Planctomycetes bacterium]|nr:hypothetical protein [Planctomycetota bacterium]
MTTSPPRPRTPAATATLWKWSWMLAALFWTLVYRLARAGGAVQDFVYVNF